MSIDERVLSKEDSMIARLDNKIIRYVSAIKDYGERKGMKHEEVMSWIYDKIGYIMLTSTACELVRRSVFGTLMFGFVTAISFVKSDYPNVSNPLEEELSLSKDGKDPYKPKRERLIGIIMTGAMLSVGLTGMIVIDRYMGILDKEPLRLLDYIAVGAFSLGVGVFTLADYVRMCHVPRDERLELIQRQHEAQMSLNK